MSDYKKQLPRYQRLFNYYIGQHDILHRTLPDKTKANNKILASYPSYVVDTVVGYMAEPIAYTSIDNNKEYLNDLNKVFFLNDEEDVNAEIIKDMTIFGKAYEVMYTDKEADVRFIQYNPLEMYVAKDSKDNITFAGRPYTVEDLDGNETNFIEVYDVDAIRLYEETGNQYKLIKETKHYFNEIPVCLYKNNDEELGDYEQQIPMIDGINKILSDSQNELEAFANAYMAITNAQGTTKEDIEALKQDGVLLLPGDSKAEWLIKNVNNQFQQDFFETMSKLILSHTATPDLTSEEFASNLSGVAIQFKLQGLENKCSIKERKMNKALRKRIRLITKILNLKGNNYEPFTIRTQFSRNIPSNENDVVDQIVKMRNLVDKETLLSWHPKIDNAQQVLDKLKEEQPEIDLEDMFKDKVKDDEQATS